MRLSISMRYFLIFFLSFVIEISIFFFFDLLQGITKEHLERVRVCLNHSSDLMR
jgi:hypothetical protein